MKPKHYATHPHTCQEHGMAFGHYYVVEVSFRPNNPVHRYVAFEARDDGTLRIVGGLERENEIVRLDQLAYFRVVEEITSMQQRSSRSMPPSFDDVL